MNRTVQQHIDSLLALMRTRNIEFMRTKDQRSRNAIEADIRTIRIALVHYESALHLEQTLASLDSSDDRGDDNVPPVSVRNGATGVPLPRSS